VRHARTGKKLGRDSAHRKALYANLTGALIEHGRIKTTVTKAKAVKPIAERMITLGRRGDLHARRQAVAFLRSKDVVHKLFEEVAPRFADRPGGYSRIVKLGPRAGDAAEMAYLELLDEPVVPRSRATAAAVAAPVAVEEPPETEAEAELEGEAEGVETEAEAEAEAAVEEPAEPEDTETEPADEPVAEAPESQVPVDDTPPPEPDDTAGPPPESGGPRQRG
jgi:large subunit ribosomal protein L17